MDIFSGRWSWWFLQSPSDVLVMWHELNFVLRGVALVLLVMLAHTVITAATMTVKIVWARLRCRRFVRESTDLFAAGRVEEVLSFAEASKKSHVAALIAAGLRAFRTAPSTLNDEEARECAERAMKRVTLMALAEIRVGLGSLRTIAATAPLFGALGTFLGVLDSFRGGSFTPWTFLMVMVGGNYIALLFTGVGLFVTVLSNWSYNWLALKLNKFEWEMKDAALAIAIQLSTHPELREAGDADITFGWNAVFPWEVPYERFGVLLVSMWAFELYLGYLLLGGIWNSPSEDMGYALKFILFLLAAGVIVLAFWCCSRGTATCAGSEERCVDDRFDWPVNGRRATRLPLRARLATLPDRSLFFAPIAGALIVMVLINTVTSTVPRGIPVWASLEYMTVERHTESPIVLQVRKKPGTVFSSTASFIVEGKLIESNELRRRLAKELERRDDRPVIVYGDEELPFQTMAEILDLVNDEGGTPVLLGNGKAKRERIAKK